MQQRRLGRIGHSSSVLMYGGAALGEVTQDVADESIELALAAGINHFDFAASYGDAELRLGPWIPRIRGDIFLATKTGNRDSESAWVQINESLERLQTDHIDLFQLHSVGNMERLDQVTAADGALHATVRARDEGLVSWIGITGHSHDAPATHLEALRRFDFDSVMTPINWVLSQDATYLAAYEAVVAEVQRRDAALMTIKTVSRRNWPDLDNKSHTTWYEPFADQANIDAAVAWALSHQEIAGIPTAGDVRLLPRLIEAERRAMSMSRDEAAAVLAQASEHSSPFIHIPI